MCNARLVAWRKPLALPLPLLPLPLPLPLLLLLLLLLLVLLLPGEVMVGMMTDKGKDKGKGRVEGRSDVVEGFDEDNDGTAGSGDDDNDDDGGGGGGGSDVAVEFVRVRLLVSTLGCAMLVDAPAAVVIVGGLVGAVVPVVAAEVVVVVMVVGSKWKRPSPCPGANPGSSPCPGVDDEVTAVAVVVRGRRCTGRSAHFNTWSSQEDGCCAIVDDDDDDDDNVIPNPLSPLPLPPSSSPCPVAML